MKKRFEKIEVDLAAGEPAAEQKKSLWAPLEEIWDGDWAPPKADVAPSLPDGGCLFYRGTIGAVMGEPSAGKSIFILQAAAAEALAGGVVWVFDPEDSPVRFVARLKKFGYPREILKSIRHCPFPSPQDFSSLLAEASSLPEGERPTLVWMDGMSVLMSQDGLAENSNDDVNAFLAMRCMPWKKLGAAVVLADHVTKREGGLWGRGGGAKKGAYDGAAYFLKVRNQFSSKQDGSVDVVCAKDRQGGVATMGQLCFEMVVRAEDESGLQSVCLIDRRAETTAAERKPFRPEKIMEAVVRRLKIVKRSAKTELMREVVGRAQWVALALDILVEDGTLEVEEDGRRIFYKIKQPTKKP
jgi:hypothetical protein